jgi:tetratricopeptide (TPR) repeat protein
MGALADRHWGDYRHADRASWLALYGPETDNLSRAMHWALRAGDGELAVRLFCPITVLLQGSGRAPDLAPMVDGLRPLLADLPPHRQAQAQLAIAVARLPYSIRDATDAARLALTLVRVGHGDAELRFQTLTSTAQYLAMGSELDEARSLIEEARALQTPVTPLVLRFALANAEFMHHVFSESYDAALAAAEHAIVLSKELRADRATHLLRVNAAACAVMQGHHAEAIAQLEHALQSCQGPSWLQARATALANLVNAYCATGDLAAAQRTAVEALPLTRRCGYLMGLLENVAELASRDGRPEAAAQIIGYLEAAEARDGLKTQADSLRTRREVLAALSTSIGPEALATARAQGAELTDDALDALVLSPAVR